MWDKHKRLQLSKVWHAAHVLKGKWFLMVGQSVAFVVLGAVSIRKKLKSNWLEMALFMLLILTSLFGGMNVTDSCTEYYYK